MIKKAYWYKCLFFVPFFICLLAACGLEDYPYIFPVPQANIYPELNDRAEIRIPTNNSGSSFTHFAVFYRIYVSDDLELSTMATATIDSLYSVINPVLASDIGSLRPYIDSDTFVNVNMDSLFQGKRYKYLGFSNGSIDTVLSDSTPSVLGSTLEFDFSSSGNPSMVKKDSAGNIIDGPYYLWRSNGNGIFSPQPDRQFLNSADLWNSDNINDNTNADVADKSSFTSDNRYTYAAMYIVAVGIDVSSYSEIYSTPSLIHVFLLPER